MALIYLLLISNAVQRFRQPPFQSILHNRGGDGYTPDATQRTNEVHSGGRNGMLCAWLVLTETPQED